MKLIDRYVLWFAVSMAIYTVMFRYGLSSSIAAGRYTLVWVIAVAYGIGLFATAWYLGRAHSKGNFMFDMGLPFNVAGYLSWGLVSELWILLGFAAPSESIGVVHTTLFIWGAILAVNFIIFLFLRKRTIKGVAKSEIFQ